MPYSPGPEQLEYVLAGPPPKRPLPRRTRHRKMPKIVVSTSSFNVAASSALRALAAAGYEIVTNPHKRRLTEEEAIDLLRDEEVVGMIAGTGSLSRAALEKARATMEEEAARNLLQALAARGLVGTASAG